MVKKQTDKLDLILKKLDEHDKKFDKVFSKFDEHDKRFADIATNFDRVFGELEKIREDRLFALAKDRELEQRIVKLEASHV